MLFKWILAPMYRALHRKSRTALLESFHNNRGYGSHERTVAGLRYLLMPATFEGNDYLPLSVRGKFQTRAGSYEKLQERLELLTSHVRSIIALGSGSWGNLPIIEEMKTDKLIDQWKDLYFKAGTDEEVRALLQKTLDLLIENAACFDDDESGATAPFHKYVAIVLRELEDIVEHFL
jgi:hypothetical protein